MIKLWGRANSSNVMKVVWLMEELGIPYERLDVGGPFGGTNTPEYRSMHPLMLVPALEDGDYTLFESNAILRYLCNAHAPQSAFYPADARQRGRVDAWLDFQQSAYAGPLATVFLGLVRTPPEKRDNAAIKAAMERGGMLGAILDEALAQQDYIAGPQLTIADMALGPLIHRWFALPIENRPDLKRLRALYDRYLTRPAYARHLALPLS